MLTTGKYLWSTKMSPIAVFSLAVTSLPMLLFSGGIQRIVEGSTLWLYCQVNSIAPTLRVTWTKNGLPLVQDVPHIRIRSSHFISSRSCTSRGNSTTFTLVVDTFQGSDSGVYQCRVDDGSNTAIGISIQLRGMYQNETACNDDFSPPAHYSICINYWIPSIQIQQCNW